MKKRILMAGGMMAALVAWVALGQTASINGIRVMRGIATAPTDGQVAVWNATSKQWEPATLEGVGGGSNWNDGSSSTNSTLAGTATVDRLSVIEDIVARALQAQTSYVGSLILTNPPSFGSGLTNGAGTASGIATYDANKKLVGVSTGVGVTNVGGALSANLAAGANITFTTNASGQVSIAASGGGGFTGAYTIALLLTISNFSPADGTVYYIGGNLNGATSSALTDDTSKVYIPKGGTITKCFVKVKVNSTLGSNETISHDLWINNTTAVALTSTSYDAAVRNIATTGLSQSVSAGDYIDLRVTPTGAWTTNPLNVSYYVQVTVEY